MNKHYFKKVGWLGTVVILVVLAFFTYFNRSYAHIYNHIDKSALTTPDRTLSYLITNNQMASSSLTYVALGDSLTSGVGVDNYNESYPYLLAQYFSGNDKQVTLKDRAVQGAKTKDVLVGLLPAAIRDNPDIVTILIGVNDVHGGISRDDFQKNYDSILQQLTVETKADIYVISIPFIGADNLILPPYNYTFDLKTKRFNNVIKELAIKYKIKYIDLYTQTEELFKTNGSHYAADFFHPSAQGYKIWADLIYADINY
jgi:lysophospholipase L1-like esterase